MRSAIAHTQARRALALVPAVAAASAALCASSAVAAPAPNVLHIICDDLGWGDVGFNGQAQIRTPNLDTLAAAGMRMINGYCPASVCAPTRGGMLSGFHNGHSSVDRNGADIGTGFRAEDFLMGQMLKQANYHTGIIGKWGFGGNSSGAEMITAPASLPHVHGYDEFYGYLNHTRAHDYFQPYVWQNNPSAPDGVETVSTNNTYTHDLFQQRAVQYIANNAGAAQPFYLEFAPTIPHDQTVDITAVPGWDSAYADHPTFASWTSGQKQYAAMITRMDAGIGELVARLNDPNGDGNPADSIADNTLVIFTSDNGPTNQSRTNFFDSNGPWKGGKRDLTEGGVRTPWVMNWANEIAAGSTSSRIVEQSDLFPTLAELAGVSETPVGIDGVSFAPLLTGEGTMRPRDMFIFESHESQGGPLSQGPQLWAIRDGDWKLIKWGDGTFRLYNLATDPTEQSNIVGANPTIKAQLESLALAEGVEQPTEYAVSYRSWSGANGANVASDASWSGSGTPDVTWSAVVANTVGGNPVAVVNSDLTFLGLGVRGINGTQRVQISSGVTLTGRNEIRISGAAQIDLLGGTLASNRWLDIRAGGTLFGRGTVNAMLYNDGTVSANGGTLILNGGGSHGGAFNVSSGAILQFAAGTHTMRSGATLGGTGAVSVTTGAQLISDATLSLPASLTFNLSGGTLSTPTLNVLGTMNYDAGVVDAANLQLVGNASMKLSPGMNKTLVVSDIGIADASRLDLSDNKLIVRASGVGSWNGSAYVGLTGMIASGRGDGSWNGTSGIVTSMTDATSGVLTTLAIASADETGYAGGTFGSQSVSSGDALVMYTWGGDADLDGDLDGDDYFQIDSNIQQSGVVFGFHRGDFDYNGEIDGDDYFLIDSNIALAQERPPFPTTLAASKLSSVPEPAVPILALVFCIPTRRVRGRP